MKLSTTTGNIQKRFGTEKAIEMVAKAGFDAYDMNMARIHLFPKTDIWTMQKS